MSIVRWEPLRDFMTLREAMDLLFEDSFVGRRPREWLPAKWALALDMYRTEDAAVIASSVPGVKPGDIDIIVSGNTLSISGETKEEGLQTNGVLILRGRSGLDARFFHVSPR